MTADKQKKLYNWKQDALGFAILLYISNTLILPYLTGFDITLIALLTSLPLHALVAYGYGRSMKWWHEHHQNEEI